MGNGFVARNPQTAAQEAAGLDVVTDGQLSGMDPMLELAERLDGIQLGPLVRPFNHQRCVHQLIVNGPIRRSAAVLAPAYRRASRVARVPVKAVLTGPHTLAHLAKIVTPAYADTTALATAFSTILAEEIRDLTVAGATLIQIDEPLILRHPADIRLVRQLLEPLKEAAGETTQIAVSTFFGDAEPLYAQLNSLPADIIGLDVSHPSALVDAVERTGASKLLALGLVGGASAGRDDPDDAVRTLERLLRRYVHDTIYLQPSCGLHELDRAHARSKLESLPRIRARFTGGVAEGMEP